MREIQEKCLFFTTKEKQRNVYLGSWKLKKMFLDILFMKRVSGPVANINQFHMIH